MKRIIVGIVLGLVACVGAGCTNDEITPVEAPIAETTIEATTEGMVQTTTVNTETSESIATITTVIEIETEDTTETIESTLLTETVEPETNCETTESSSTESIEETTENFQ